MPRWRKYDTCADCERYREPKCKTTGKKHNPLCTACGKYSYADPLLEKLEE